MSHKKVQVVILRRNQKSTGHFDLLLLQTNKKRGEFWQNVTGSVEKSDGEQLPYLHGAQREVREETGITAPLTSFIDLQTEFRFKDRWGKDVIERAFLLVLESDHAPVQIDSKEHQNYRWCNAGEILPTDYRYESNFSTLQTALQCLNRG